MLTNIYIYVYMGRHSYQWTYNSGTTAVVELFRYGFLHCWSRSKSMHFSVINHLRIKMLVGAKHAQSWPFCCSFNLRKRNWFASFTSAFSTVMNRKNSIFNHKQRIRNKEQFNWHYRRQFSFVAFHLSRHSNSRLTLQVLNGGHSQPRHCTSSIQNL